MARQRSLSLTDFLAGLVIVMLIGGLWGWMNSRDNETTPVQEVSWTRSLEAANADGILNVIAPTTLPDGWRATSVRYIRGQSASWHLGILTADEKYVGIEVALTAPETLVRRHVDKKAEQLDPVMVGGQKWDSWVDDGGDYALSRQDGRQSTLIVGTEPPEVIREFVAGLE